ncbi:MAG: 2-oxoglutarate and iron-dependent oxygenase domain-containing protein, partial [Burkholderiaceae bacterium]
MNAFERPDARTANTDCRAIPVVDLGPLIRGEKDAIEKITAPWRDACENLGFLCVINHGVDARLIEDMETQSRRFHDDLSVDQKMQVRVTKD